MEPRKRNWWLLGLGLLILLFVNLGTRGFNEPDETRYANIAHGMLDPQSGWWVPRLSQFGHFDKPPLTYWFTAASFKALGENEWAARLPCVFGAILTLTGLGWTAFRLYGERVAWWSVLFCGTMGQFWFFARFLMPEMLLTGWCTLAVAFWAEERHRGARGAWWWGMALCWALAWWTKATAALIPLLALTVGLLITRQRTGLYALRPIRTLLFVIALGAPWYWDLMHRYPELKDFFFGRELAGRVAGHPDGRKGPIYYHLALSLLLWAPWWPMALVRLGVRRGQVLNRLRRLHWQALPLEAWLVLIGLVVYSLISSKLPGYTLPFAPWAALLSARVWLELGRESANSVNPRPLLAVAASYAAVLIALTFIIPRHESNFAANSSLREVAAILREKKAEVVYLDRFMPGLEWYFGEHAFYVTDKSLQQLTSDTGFCPALGESHFVATTNWLAHVRSHPGTNVWLVRYKGRPSEVFTPMIGAVPDGTVRVGDFALDRLPAATP